MRGEGWARALREAPLGVLVIALLLLFVGSGLVLTGAYLLVSGLLEGWTSAVALFAGGPLVLWVALRFARLRMWAWRAVLLFLMLLLASSIVRIASATDRLPLFPWIEIGLECTGLLYLARPRTRAAFEQSGQPGSGRGSTRTSPSRP